MARTNAASGVEHAPGSPSAPSEDDVTAAAETATPVLQAVLHQTHEVCVAGGKALSVSVENLETGDKFHKTIFKGDVDALVPEKLRAGGDVEELADLEFILLESLKSEAAGGAQGDAADVPPEMRSQSREVPASGKGEFARFDIVMIITKGLRGRPKTHTIELSIPLVSASTDEDKVRNEGARLRVALMLKAFLFTSSSHA